jgi:hypothetical protein
MHPERCGATTTTFYMAPDQPGYDELGNPASSSRLRVTELIVGCMDQVNQLKQSSLCRTTEPAVHQ